MLPSSPLIPCETYCGQMRTDAEGERVSASDQLQELLMFTAQYFLRWKASPGGLGFPLRLLDLEALVNPPRTRNRKVREMHCFIHSN